MRKLVIYLALAAGIGIPTAAWAACTTHTYYVNGRYVTCTTCCTGSYCNTNCY
jgi:hypothetical protein